ncbi:hypothetical protein CHS0354_042295 [Potamilus streckersoni]|uniref:RING-type domain-containing protein n=1 Tax=Potamilus streckersoni TaxID=2493646 RepID=A0AAE0SU29_9BIVA|nr:hypothetical protein CHS0354_042295 [Potamilus streckersoni]
MEETKEICIDPSLLSCPICNRRFNEKKHIPRVLPCLHVTCEKCLHVNLRGKSIDCPSCRMYHKLPSADVRGYPMDNNRRSMREFFRIKMKSHRLRCKNCSDGEKPIHLCKVCVELLYSKCSDIHLHKRNQATNQHRVVHLRELRAIGFDIFKRNVSHPTTKKYDLTFFCNNADCHEPICDACAVSKHRVDEGHVHCSIEEAYKEKKILFINSIKTFSEQIKDICEIEKDLQDKIDNAKALMEGTCREIDTYFDNLISHLNEKREKLKRQTKNTIGLLNEMRMKRDERSTFVNFVDHMLDNGGETDLLLVSKLLTERTDQLKKQNFWQKSADKLGIYFKQYVTEEELRNFINNISGIKSISVSSENSTITLSNCPIGIKSCVATIVLRDHYGTPQMNCRDDMSP